MAVVAIAQMVATSLSLMSSLSIFIFFTFLMFDAAKVRPFFVLSIPNNNFFFNLFCKSLFFSVLDSEI